VYSGINIPCIIRICCLIRTNNLDGQKMFASVKNDLFLFLICCQTTGLLWSILAPQASKYGMIINHICSFHHYFTHLCLINLFTNAWIQVCFCSFLFITFKFIETESKLLCRESNSPLEQHFSLIIIYLLFSWTDCGVKFSAKSSLYVHLKKHNKPKSAVGDKVVYHCPIEKCSRTYTCKSSLRQHMLKFHTPVLGK
jgi:hypothetical protein